MPNGLSDSSIFSNTSCSTRSCSFVRALRLPHLLQHLLPSLTCVSAPQHQCHDVVLPPSLPVPPSLRLAFSGLSCTVSRPLAVDSVDSCHLLGLCHPALHSRFQLGQSSRAPADSTKRVRLTRSIGSWLSVTLTFISHGHLCSFHLLLNPIQLGSCRNWLRNWLWNIDRRFTNVHFLSGFWMKEGSQLLGLFVSTLAQLVSGRSLPPWPRQCDLGICRRGEQHSHCACLTPTSCIPNTRLCILTSRDLSSWRISSNQLSEQQASRSKMRHLDLPPPQKRQISPNSPVLVSAAMELRYMWH